MATAKKQMKLDFFMKKSEIKETSDNEEEPELTKEVIYC